MPTGPPDPRDRRARDRSEEEQRPRPDADDEVPENPGVPDDAERQTDDVEEARE